MDVRAPPFSRDDPGPAKHAKVVRDRGLREDVTDPKVARTDVALGGELANDIEPRLIRERREQGDLPGRR